VESPGEVESPAPGGVESPAPGGVESPGVSVEFPGGSGESLEGSVGSPEGSVEFPARLVESPGGLVESPGGSDQPIEHAKLMARAITKRRPPKPRRSLLSLAADHKANASYACPAPQKQACIIPGVLRA
jgi:hypothetical protein